VTHYYELGTVRWWQHDGTPNMKKMSRQKGWEASACLTNRHPITEQLFKEPQWWIREELTGIEGVMA
jgi:hypothetical protein